LLTRLKEIGVDYIFANSGTDFPPIIEGLAEAAAKDLPLPEALVMPHEHAAMGMAHGYYLASGRAQAVMAHTNVGLANCAIGAINAAMENIPVLLFSGRTPVTEAGRLGTRTVPIGWGQEMRDQTALVREATKWDYELRFPEQTVEVVDRAYAVANSTPKGPVYVSLPREALCEVVDDDRTGGGPSMAPVSLYAGAELIAQAAALLSRATNPVIFAQHGAGSAEAFEALGALADKWGIPVCQYWAVQLAIPTTHPMATGPDPKALVENADVILVLDALAPWSPEVHQSGAQCKIIHMGPDPLKARTPIRNFRSDVSIACELGQGVMALAAAMEALGEPAPAIAARRSRVAKSNADDRRALTARAEAGAHGVMTKEWVSLTLSKALEGRRARVLSELGCPMGPMVLDHHQAWYQEPHAGGLGWSFPAALGMQLHDRKQLIVATMGDGSYMFANPVACHQIAEALALPILVVILNNSEWGAVRQSVLCVYPDGFASRANRMPLTSLAPVPDFARIASASRAWSATVTQASDLEDSIQEALAHIETNRTLALLDVRVRP
jgi:acetolactate synthase-1/2/3 large subunit